MSDTERSLARCGKADLIIEDHGILLLSVTFDYDGSSQGFPSYHADPSIIYRFLGAIGVDSLSQVEGKSCWVTHTRTDIVKIEPLHKKDGVPFDIREWKKWAEERLPKISPYEYRTGEKR